MSDSLCCHACNTTGCELRVWIDVCRIAVPLEVGECAFRRFIRSELKIGSSATGDLLLFNVQTARTYLDSSFRHDFDDI